MIYKLKEWEEQHDNILNGYSTIERVREIYGDKTADRIQKEFDKRALIDKKIELEFRSENHEEIERIGNELKREVELWEKVIKRL